MAPVPHAVAIIGSGFSGLGAAIRLRQEGVTDLIVLERAAALGGVWRENRYPGCACDVESHLYEYAFAPNPNWTRRYSPSEEIWTYLEECADRFDVRRLIRFGAEVTRAEWDDAAAVWRISTSVGPYTARVLVCATGALAEPRPPALPGLDAFQGPVFHSARWDHSVNLAGKRVVVLGTGASAVQFIPAIQPQVSRLIVFQRTPAWVVPRRDRPVPDRLKRLFRRMPATQRWLRRFIFAYRELLGIGFRRPWVLRMLSFIATRHRTRQVPDPDLRRRLTPEYGVGCKRILVSDDYYPALGQPNVELVSGAAAAITPTGVVGADGVERPADVIVCGTGFQVTEFLFARWIVGREGRTLSQAWARTATAHLGTTVAGFPNLFLIPGPNTGLGHSSVIMMFEAQIEHLVSAVRHLETPGVLAMEPTADAQAAFVAEVDRRMARTVWVTGGCRSWYLDATGRNSTLWPGSIPEYRRRVRRFRPREYRIRRD